MTTPNKLTPHDERRVAVAAGCDPRTVRSVLEGRPAHSTTKARVETALRELGLVAKEAAQSLRDVVPELERLPREEKAR